MRLCQKQMSTTRDNKAWGLGFRVRGLGFRDCMTERFLRIPVEAEGTSTKVGLLLRNLTYWGNPMIYYVCALWQLNLSS